MKKCPECGNPSYDGAPVCGNCGYKFPKPKIAASKREDIFQQKPKENKKSDDESTISIIKNNKILIGTILLITLLVICGIVFTGSDNDTPTIQTDVVSEYSAGDFSFKYPDNWKQVNLTDSEHEGAIFFSVDNETIVEHYNVTSDSPSLKQITQDRIANAQSNGANVELVETITLDGRNSSNFIIENADGNYTRYVSMLSKGELYVFKISGESFNSVTNEEINKVLNSADIV